MRCFKLLLCLFFPLFSFGQYSFPDSTYPQELLFFCGNFRDTVKKPVQLKWVELDKKIIRNTINKVPENGATISGLVKLVPHLLSSDCTCLSTEYDLGYGLKSIHHSLCGAGYGGYYIDALYFDDHVIRIRLTVSNYREIISDHLLKEMKLRFKCDDGHIVHDITYKDNLNRYLADSGRLFLQSADTNEIRREAINYFAKLLNGYNFDEPFYFQYGLGKSMDYLRYFIVNKDYDGLENILYSSNPTGRLFAARTLVYMQEKNNYKPAEKIAKRIKETIATAQIIRSGMLSCWIGRFEHDYFDVVKNFEEYLLTK